MLYRIISRKCKSISTAEKNGQLKQHERFPSNVGLYIATAKQATEDNCVKHGSHSLDSNKHEDEGKSSRDTVTLIIWLKKLQNFGGKQSAKQIPGVKRAIERHFANDSLNLEETNYLNEKFKVLGSPD